MTQANFVKNIPCIKSIFASILLLVLLVNLFGTMAAFSTESDFNPLTALQNKTNSIKNSKKLKQAAEILSQYTGLQDKVRVKVALADGRSIRPQADWRDPASVEVYRGSIKILQFQVIEQLSESEYEIRKVYENIPGLSLSVTIDGLSKLVNHPQVVSVEPVQILEPHLKQGLALIQGETYRSQYAGQGVSVAIVDTGVDYRHPYLGNGGFPNSKVIGGYDIADDDPDPIPNEDTVNSAHGTCCAGIVAGNLANMEDYVGGVAPQAKLYALKIQDTNGVMTDESIIGAWDWCISHKNDNPDYPILVISNSIGKGYYSFSCDMTEVLIGFAAATVASNGITLTASSGNNGFCDGMCAPACNNGVISVGAAYDGDLGFMGFCVSNNSCFQNIVFPSECPNGSKLAYQDTTKADDVTSYSNSADFLDLLAPSHNAYTTDQIGGNGYSPSDFAKSFGGTSAACPYAAGAVACIQSAAKSIKGKFLTPLEVEELLRASGDAVKDGKSNLSTPRLNLKHAIDSLGGGALPTPTQSQVQPTPTPVVGGDVLYSENFDSGNAANWALTTGQWYIDGGSLHGVGAGGGNKYPTVYSGQVFSDFRVSYDVKFAGGSQNYSYGIIYRYDKSLGGLYTFNFSSNGYWLASKIVNKQIINLSDWQEIPGFQDQSWNHVSIVVKGIQHTFYLNGNKLGEFVDNSMASGYFGLFIDSDIHALFDNFVVQKPEAAVLPTPTIPAGVGSFDLEVRDVYLVVDDGGGDFDDDVRIKNPAPGQKIRFYGDLNNLGPEAAGQYDCETIVDGELYGSGKSTESLPPDYYTLWRSPAWSSPISGTHTVEWRFNAPGDSNPANNSLEIQFQVGQGGAPTPTPTTVPIQPTPTKTPTPFVSPTPTKAPSGVILGGGEITVQPGESFDLPIQIKNITNGAFLIFEVFYDAEVFTYEGQYNVKGMMLESFTQVTVNEQMPGELYVVALDFSKHSAVGSGTLMTLKFKGKDQISTGKDYQIIFDRFEQDIEGAQSIPVTIHFGSQGKKGDVNADGEITAGDAQLAFQFALEKIQPTTAQKWAADINEDGEITADDANKIWLMALTFGQALNNTGYKIETSQSKYPGQIHSKRSSSLHIPVSIRAQYPVRAFTLDVEYDPLKLAFNALDIHDSLAKSFALIGTQRIRPGLLRVAGIQGEQTSILRSGVLFSLDFTPLAGAPDLSSIRITNVKDIKGNYRIECAIPNSH